MSTATRVQRLEQAIAGMGGHRCPHCGDWPTYKSTFPDGRSSDPHPVTCPRCGWSREVVIEVVYARTGAKA